MLEQPAFGNRLRALRLERGLSQAALAKGGLSTGYLSRLESGMRSPTNRVLDHLSKQLGVPVTAFDEQQAASTLAEALARAASTPDRDDVVETLVQALHTDDNRDPALRWQALWLLAQAHLARGEGTEEHALLLELAGLSDRLAAPELGVRARIRLSRAAAQLGDLARAREYAQEVYRGAETLPTADRAEALQALIAVETEAGQLTEAQSHAQELSRLTEPLGGARHAASLAAAAAVSMRLADYGTAQKALEAALSAVDSRSDLVLWLELRLSLASLYLQVTPATTERAMAVLEEIAPVVELVGTDLHRQQVLALRAQLAYAEGRATDARELFERIDDRLPALPQRDRMRLQALRSKLRILDGKFDEGTRELQRLAEQARAIPDMELSAEIWRDLAETLASAYRSSNR